MVPEKPFDRLARRDVELNTIATRGRRRSLRLLVLSMVPAPFVVMLTNRDSSLSAVIPVFVVCVGSVSYSWNKWRRRPEDAPSITFMGLDRKTRWSAYRSLWRGSGVDDPIVLAMFESMHDHLRRSFAMVAASLCAAAVAGAALVYGGDGLHAGWVSMGIAVLLGTAITLQRLSISRSAVVIDRSLATHAS
jgi:hypothetical protein